MNSVSTLLPSVADNSTLLSWIHALCARLTILRSFPNNLANRLGEVHTLRAKWLKENILSRFGNLVPTRCFQNENQKLEI